ncbi:MAG: hypothetical protein AB7F74_25105 [Parvibaculaceae bacterium]
MPGKVAGLLIAIKDAFTEIDFLMLPSLPVETPQRGISTVRLGDREIAVLEALIRHIAIFDQTGRPALALPLHSGKMKVA